MLLDARSLPPNEVVHADICIVGAGPAGIAIASTLVNHPARVVLLESGGTAPDEACQDLYRGVTTGRPYFSLDACRIR
jgi:flavin-dependent dehydrogenase